MSATGRNIKPREVLDYYATPPQVVEHILPIVMEGLDSEALVLDPACGDGNILVAVRKHYPDVYLHGIEIDNDRFYDCCERLENTNHRQIKNADALSSLEAWSKPDIIIMNPPFKHTMAFLRFALSCCERVAMIQQLNFIGPEGKEKNGWSRRELFDRYACDLLVLGKRPRFSNYILGNGGSDHADYAWFWFHPEAKRRWRHVP